MPEYEGVSTAGKVVLGCLAVLAVLLLCAVIALVLTGGAGFFYLKKVGQVLPEGGQFKYKRATRWTQLCIAKLYESPLMLSIVSLR